MAKSVKKKAPLPKARRKKQAAPETRAKQSKKGLEIDPVKQFKPHHSSVPPSLPAALRSQASPEVLNRLWTIIESRKAADPEASHSARLLARGTGRVAQKLGEEAVECLIELVAGNREGIIGESADVLYHLLVAWVSADIRPEDVWHELEQRERVSSLAEGDDVPLKRLLGSVQIGTRKIP